MIDDRRIGQIRVTFPNLPDNGSAQQQDGPLADEFKRLTIFMQDLFAAKAFMDRALAADEPIIIESLGISALTRFLRCFESTAGLRVKPLKPSKIFAPDDRVKLKELVATRHKFVIHDDQTHPMLEAILLFDGNGIAIDMIAMTVPMHFQGFAISAELHRLIGVALDFVRSAHLSVGDEIKRGWNEQLDPEKRGALKAQREIVIDILRNANDDRPRDWDAHSDLIEYVIPGELLPKSPDS